jgi:hypothetical protein
MVDKESAGYVATKKEIRDNLQRVCEEQLTISQQMGQRFVANLENGTATVGEEYRWDQQRDLCKFYIQQLTTN